MTLSADIIAKINKSCKALQLGAVGTLLASLESDMATAQGDISDLEQYTGNQLNMTPGFHLVTSEEQSANLATISLPMFSVIASCWIQIVRSGVNVTADAVVDVSAGSSVTVADGASTYSVTDGDVIHFIVTGVPAV